MLIVNIKLTGVILTHQQFFWIHTRARSLMVNVLRKKHDLLAGVMGLNLHPINYVVLDEVAADAWGYGGRSQHDRALSAQHTPPN